MNIRKNQEIFSEEEQLRNEQAVQALIELPTVKLIATSDNEATQQLNLIWLRYSWVHHDAA